MKTRYILILIAGLLGFWSCIDDEGNYKYIELPGLTINKGTMASLQAIVGEPVTYDPKVEYEVPADSVYFTYIWYEWRTLFPIKRYWNSLLYKFVNIV